MPTKSSKTKTKDIDNTPLSPYKKGQAQLGQLLHQPGLVSDLLKVGEDKTGLDRLTIFFILLAVVIVWLLYGHTAQLLCNVIGFAYPAYCSIIALTQGTRKQSEKDKTGRSVSQ